MRLALPFLNVVLAAMCGVCACAGATSAATVKDASVAVHGTAVSITGKPLPNIEGTFSDQKSGRLGPEWKSGKDGRFQAKLKPGTYKVWAHGAVMKAVDLVVRAGEGEKTVRVTGTPYNGLKLIFESPDGKTVPKVLIPYGMRNGMDFLETDSDGSAVIREEGLPLRLFFFLNRVGYASLNIDTEASLYGEKPVAVRLQSGITLAGRLVSKDGSTPLGGVPIVPERKYSQGDPWSGWNSLFGFKSFSYTIKDPSVTVSRDGDGQFSIGPLPPGDYNLLMGLTCVPENTPAIDLIEPTRQEISVAHDKTTDDITLRASLKQPAHTLQGCILKTDKTPLASTEVIISLSGQYKPMEEPEEWYVWEPVNRRVVTDAQGRFKLYPVRPGKYRMVAKRGKLSATRDLTVSGDASGVEFLLKG